MSERSRPTRRDVLRRTTIAAGGVWLAPQVLATGSAHAASGTFALQLQFGVSGCTEVSPTGSARCNPLGWNPLAPISLAAAQITVASCAAGVGGGSPTLSANATGLCTFSDAVAEGYDETTGRLIPVCFSPTSLSPTSLSMSAASKYVFVVVRIVVTCLS